MVFLAIAPLTIGSTLYYFSKDENGLVSQISAALYEEAKEEGVPIVMDIVEGLSDVFGTLGNQVLEVIEGAGIAVLKASEKTWFYISEQVADRRVPAVAVGWAMLVYAITAATIYNRIKKA